MDRLKLENGTNTLYLAGLPHFPRNFTRDSIISGMLMADSMLIRNQLEFCAQRQGVAANSVTGEEPGKIFHEFPGVLLHDNKSTEYSACDTTALYILGHEHYLKLTGDTSLIESHSDNIKNAVSYIKKHLNDHIFVEDPRHAGAKSFALKVTYWKDSELANRDNGIPAYPISYFLAHAVNLAAMRSAARMLKSEELHDTAQKMKERLHDFYNPLNQKFAFAIDAQGKIDVQNSDMLHALYYLEQGDLNEDEIASIVAHSKELETPIGYRTMAPTQHQMMDSYHSKTVWPFEQAIIHQGAKKFGLERILEVSSNIMANLDTDPEIFIVDGNNFRKGGCDPQLWTIAAKRYFNNMLITTVVE